MNTSSTKTLTGVIDDFGNRIFAYQFAYETYMARYIYFNYGGFYEQ